MKKDVKRKKIEEKIRMEERRHTPVLDLQEPELFYKVYENPYLDSTKNLQGERSSPACRG